MNISLTRIKDSYGIKGDVFLSNFVSIDTLQAIDPNSKLLSFSTLAAVTSTPFPSLWYIFNSLNPLLNYGKSTSLSTPNTSNLAIYPSTGNIPNPLFQALTLGPQHINSDVVNDIIPNDFIVSLWFDNHSFLNSFIQTDLINIRQGNDNTILSISIMDDISLKINFNDHVFYINISETYNRGFNHVLFMKKDASTYIYHNSYLLTTPQYDTHIFNHLRNNEIILGSAPNVLFSDLRIFQHSTSTDDIKRLFYTNACDRLIGVNPYPQYSIYRHHADTYIHKDYTQDLITPITSSFAISFWLLHKTESVKPYMYFKDTSDSLVIGSDDQTVYILISSQRFSFPYPIKHNTWTFISISVNNSIVQLVMDKNIPIFIDVIKPIVTAPSLAIHTIIDDPNVVIEDLCVHPFNIDFFTVVDMYIKYTKIFKNINGNNNPVFTTSDVSSPYSYDVIYPNQSSNLQTAQQGFINPFPNNLIISYRFDNSLNIDSTLIPNYGIDPGLHAHVQNSFLNPFTRITDIVAPSKLIYTDDSVDTLFYFTKGTYTIKTNNTYDADIVIIGRGGDGGYGTHDMPAGGGSASQFVSVRATLYANKTYTVSVNNDSYILDTSTNRYIGISKAGGRGASALQGYFASNGGGGSISSGNTIYSQGSISFSNRFFGGNGSDANQILVGGGGAGFTSSASIERGGRGFFSDISGEFIEYCHGGNGGNSSVKGSNTPGSGGDASMSGIDGIVYIRIPFKPSQILRSFTTSDGFLHPSCLNVVGKSDPPANMISLSNPTSMLKYFQYASELSIHFWHRSYNDISNAILNIDNNVIITYDSKLSLKIFNNVSTLTPMHPYEWNHYTINVSVANSIAYVHIFNHCIDSNNKVILDKQVTHSYTSAPFLYGQGMWLCSDDRDGVMYSLEDFRMYNRIFQVHETIAQFTSSAKISKVLPFPVPNYIPNSTINYIFNLPTYIDNGIIYNLNSTKYPAYVINNDNIVYDDASISYRWIKQSSNVSYLTVEETEIPREVTYQFKVLADYDKRYTMLQQSRRFNDAFIETFSINHLHSEADCDTVILYINDSSGCSETQFDLIGFNSKASENVYVVDVEGKSLSIYLGDAAIPVPPSREPYLLSWYIFDNATYISDLGYLHNDLLTNNALSTITNPIITVGTDAYYSFNIVGNHMMISMKTDPSPYMVRFTSNMLCDILIVAGGDSVSLIHNRGGRAGQVILISNFTLLANTTYEFTVGNIGQPSTFKTPDKTFTASESFTDDTIGFACDISGEFKRYSRAGPAGNSSELPTLTPGSGGKGRGGIGQPGIVIVRYKNTVETLSLSKGLVTSECLKWDGYSVSNHYLYTRLPMDLSTFIEDGITFSLWFSEGNINAYKNIIKLKNGEIDIIRFYSLAQCFILDFNGNILIGVKQYPDHYNLHNICFSISPSGPVSMFCDGSEMAYVQDPSIPSKTSPSPLNNLSLYVGKHLDDNFGYQIVDDSFIKINDLKIYRFLSPSSVSKQRVNPDSQDFRIGASSRSHGLSEDISPSILKKIEIQLAESAETSNINVAFLHGNIDVSNNSITRLPSTKYFQTFSWEFSPLNIADDAYIQINNFGALFNSCYSFNMSVIFRRTDSNLMPDIKIYNSRSTLFCIEQQNDSIQFQSSILKNESTYSIQTNGTIPASSNEYMHCYSLSYDDNLLTMSIGYINAMDSFATSNVFPVGSPYNLAHNMEPLNIIIGSNISDVAIFNRYMSFNDLQQTFLSNRFQDPVIYYPKLSLTNQAQAFKGLFDANAQRDGTRLIQSEAIHQFYSFGITVSYRKSYEVFDLSMKDFTLSFYKDFDIPLLTFYGLTYNDESVSKGRLQVFNRHNDLDVIYTTTNKKQLIKTGQFYFYAVSFYYASGVVTTNISTATTNFSYVVHTNNEQSFMPFKDIDLTRTDYVQMLFAKNNQPIDAKFSIEDIKIYNKALKTTEVEDIFYNNSINSSLSQKLTNLYVWYSFEDLMGYDVIDLTRFHNDGRIHNDGLIPNLDNIRISNNIPSGNLDYATSIEIDSPFTYITSGDDVSLDAFNDISILIKTYVNAPNVYSIFTSDYLDISMVDSNSLNITFNNKVTSIPFSKSFINNWTSLALVAHKDPSSIDLFINGIYLSTAKYNEAMRFGDGFTILKTRTNDILNYDINILDFRIYNTAISGSDIYKYGNTNSLGLKIPYVTTDFIANVENSPPIVYLKDIELGELDSFKQYTIDLTEHIPMITQRKISIERQSSNNYAALLSDYRLLLSTRSSDSLETVYISVKELFYDVVQELRVYFTLRPITDSSTTQLANLTEPLLWKIR